MAALLTLTLKQGGSETSFTEHPIEVARRALIAAAEVEEPVLAASLRRVAAALPHRRPLPAARLDQEGGE